MSDIKFPPITEALKKRLQTPWDPTLADTINPTMVLEAERPEWGLYTGELLCAQTQFLVTAGVNFQHLGLWNPSNDLVLVVQGACGYIHQLTGGAQPVPQPSLYRMLSTAGTSLHLAANVRDYRWDSTAGTGSRQGQAQFRSLSAAAANGIQQGMTRLTASQTAAAGNTTVGWDLPFFEPYVIGPNSGLWIVYQPLAAGTTTVVASFYWRERQASSWEKALTPVG